MTIEIPTPSAELLSQLETATIEVTQSEVAAVAAIRERFALYAKHNGHIKIASYNLNNSNYSIDEAVYYTRGGKLLKGLLAWDHFTESHTDQNRGTRSGSRIYLLETGEWLRLTRVGRWTQWQGEPRYWECGVSAAPDSDQDGPSDVGGSVDVISDADVDAMVDLEELLKDLGASMAEMCKKLPDRYNRLKVRAELAQRVLTA